MKLSSINALLKSKLSTSYEFPSLDILSSYVYESMLYVCNKCEPAVLVRFNTASYDDNREKYRYTRNDSYIIIPDMPDFTNEDEHLMIDESLTFAVINYTCFLIAKDTGLIYKKLCDEIIADFIANDGRGVESSYLNY